MRDRINLTINLTYSKLKTKPALVRLLLTFVFSLLLVGVSSGQVAILLLLFGDDLATEEVHLSIDGAVNSSYMSQLEQGKTLGGLNFGLGLHVKLNQNWEFNPQFRPLSGKGMRGVLPIIPPPGELTGAKSSFRLNYMDVPVFIRHNLTPDLFVAAGPQISLLTAAHQFSEGKYEYDDSKANMKIDAKPYFHKVDFSFPVEVGYWLRLSTKKSTSKVNLIVFARYCPGFTPVIKDNAYAEKSKLSTFQLGLSFPFIKGESLE